MGRCNQFNALQTTHYTAQQSNWLQLVKLCYNVPGLWSSHVFSINLNRSGFNLWRPFPLYPLDPNDQEVK
jgi:hypothetical protein